MLLFVDQRGELACGWDTTCRASISGEVQDKCPILRGVLRFLSEKCKYQKGKILVGEFPSFVLRLFKSWSFSLAWLLNIPYLLDNLPHLQTLPQKQQTLIAKNSSTAPCCALQQSLSKIPLCVSRSALGSYFNNCGAKNYDTRHLLWQQYTHDTKAKYNWWHPISAEDNGKQHVSIKAWWATVSHSYTLQKNQLLEWDWDCRLQ